MYKFFKKEKQRQIHKEYLTSLTLKETINYHSLLNSGIETILRDEAYDIFYKTINTLPDKTKEAFCLNRFHNKTYNEIADIQKVSVKNIEYRIMSALKILRKNLSDFLPICLGFFISTFVI
jgi:DNA-directed RNA polymerase specialized sigma subunit, sigma24 homolog